MVMAIDPEVYSDARPTRREGARRLDLPRPAAHKPATSQPERPMPLLAAFLVFAVFGWFRAARQGAGTADKLRYGFIHGLAGLLLMLFVGVISDLPVFRG